VKSPLITSLAWKVTKQDELITITKRLSG